MKLLDDIVCTTWIQFNTIEVHWIELDPNWFQIQMKRNGVEGIENLLVTMVLERKPLKRFFLFLLIWELVKQVLVWNCHWEGWFFFTNSNILSTYLLGLYTLPMMIN